MGQQRNKRRRSPTQLCYPRRSSGGPAGHNESPKYDLPGFGEARGSSRASRASGVNMSLDGIFDGNEDEQIRGGERAHTWVSLMA